MVIVGSVLFLLLVLFTTKNLLSALAAALVGVIVFGAHQGVGSFFSELCTQSCFVFSTIQGIIFSPDYYYSLIFLVLISWVIELFMVSGVTKSYEMLFRKIITGKKQFERTVLSFSFFLFLDDYLSVMSMKSFFSPLLSLYRVTKERFAYFVCGNASPIASLAPIGTWSAVFATQLTALMKSWGIEGKGGYFVFLSAVPYFLYSFISIASTWRVFLRDSSSAGIVEVPQKKDEKIALTSLVLFFLPIVSLLGYLAAVFFTLYRNNPQHFVELVASLNFSMIMTKGLTVGIFLAVLFLYARGMLRGWSGAITLKNTIIEMGKPIGTLVLAWSFSQCILSYIDREALVLFMGTHAWIQSFIPLIFMLLAMVSAMILGTVWGTAALLTSILTVFPPLHNLPLVFGAIVSGGLAGSHLSPTSDATIAASIAANNDPFATLRFQFRFVMPGILAVIMTYLGIGIFEYRKGCCAWSPLLLLGMVLLFYTMLFPLFVKKNEKV